MTDFNGFHLRQKIGLLSRDKQLAFLLLLCERMIPALIQFASETGFSSSIYQECLQNAWHYLERDINLSNIDKLAEQCLDHAPDTEKFDHPLTSAALNAVLLVTTTMGFLADNDADHVAEAAGLARDTAALYAQNIATTPPHSLGFREVMEHPLVQRELRQQAEDLKFLESLPTDVPQEMIPLIKEYAGRASGLPPQEN